MPTIVNPARDDQRHGAELTAVMRRMPAAMRATASWLRDPARDDQRRGGSLWRDQDGNDCTPEEAAHYCVLGYFGTQLGSNEIHPYFAADLAFGDPSCVRYSRGVYQAFDAAMHRSNERGWRRFSPRQAALNALAQRFERAADELERRLATSPPPTPAPEPGFGELALALAEQLDELAAGERELALV